MARITIEDCLDHVPNRFALVLMAAERTKQLVRGADPLLHDHRDNKEIVLALREIAAEKVIYHEKQVHEFDPASEAEIRRAAQIRAIPEGKEPKIEARTTAEGDFDDELDDADLDEEFAEETDLDKLFSKLDSSGTDDSDDEDDVDSEEVEEEEEDDTVDDTDDETFDDVTVGFDDVEEFEDEDEDEEAEED